MHGPGGMGAAASLCTAQRWPMVLGPATNTGSPTGTLVVLGMAEERSMPPTPSIYVWAMACRPAAACYPSLRRQLRASQVRALLTLTSTCDACSSLQP